MAQGLPMLLPPFHLTNLFEVLCAKPISIRSGRLSISSNTPSSDSPDGLSHFSQSQQDTAQSQVAGGKDAADVSCCQNGENSDLSVVDAQKGVSIEKVSATVATQKQKNGKDSDSDKKKKTAKKKHNLWWIKATIISLVLSAFFSYISNLVENANQLIIVIVLLAFLIISGIVFDAIGVAVTSCDVTPIISMASRKVYGAKTALNLVKNSDTVSSVCNDIIGDIFSIISGACSAALVVKITATLKEPWQIALSIAVSAIVSALTIGGKAFMKRIAINNSKDFVMFVARIIAIFSKEERKIRQKNKAAKQEQKECKDCAPAKDDSSKADKSKDDKAQTAAKPSKTEKKQNTKGEKR